MHDACLIEWEFDYLQDGSSVRISGFGTGALTWTNTDKAEFGRPNQASGATKDVTTGVDSNLGLQADYPINSWLSVTGQGLVRKDAQGIEQIGRAIDDMDQMTQQNSALVEEASAAAESLAEQTEQLSGALAQFKLRLSRRLGCRVGR